MGKINICIHLFIINIYYWTKGVLTDWRCIFVLNNLSTQTNTGYHLYLLHTVILHTSLALHVFWWLFSAITIVRLHLPIDVHRNCLETRFIPNLRYRIWTKCSSTWTQQKLRKKTWPHWNNVTSLQNIILWTHCYATSSSLQRYLVVMQYLKWLQLEFNRQTTLDFISFISLSETEILFHKHYFH